MSNRRPAHALLILAAVVICLVTLACGSGDNGGSSTPTRSPGPNGTVDPGAEERLRDLAGKWGNSSAKVTYTLTNAAGNAEVVFYRTLSERRIDHTLAGKTTTIIATADKGYSCLNLSNSCALLDGEEAVAAAEFIPFLGPLADPTGLNAIISGADSMGQVEGRQIAGKDTTCIRATGSLGGIPGPATFCFSDDGLLLAIKYEGAPPYEMTATAAGESQASDFEPPYPVATFPATPTPTS